MCEAKGKKGIHLQQLCCKVYPLLLSCVKKIIKSVVKLSPQ